MAVTNTGDEFDLKAAQETAKKMLRDLKNHRHQGISINTASIAKFENAVDWTLIETEIPNMELEVKRVQNIAISRLRLGDRWLYISCDRSLGSIKVWLPIFLKTFSTIKAVNLERALLAIAEIKEKGHDIISFVPPHMESQLGSLCLDLGYGMVRVGNETEEFDDCLLERALLLAKYQAGFGD